MSLLCSIRRGWLPTQGYTWWSGVVAYLITRASTWTKPLGAGPPGNILPSQPFRLGPLVVNFLPDFSRSGGFLSRRKGKWRIC